MTSKLDVYNDALEHLEERHLANLTEEREARRKLDFAYNRVVRRCLTKGLWNFATRTIQLDKSVSITPNFGFQYAFIKPADWLRTAKISADETMQTPLNDYVDERDWWGANTDPLYISYISDGENWGLNLARWPETFTAYVGAELAFRVCSAAGSSGMRAEIEKRAKKYLIEARAADALNQPTAFPPVGSWVTSRGANVGGGSRGW